ncbi:hypothetical protein KUCAC02_003449, partial [Chaenocephalus aceratus]
MMLFTLATTVLAKKYELFTNGTVKLGNATKRHSGDYLLEEFGSNGSLLKMLQVHLEIQDCVPSFPVVVLAVAGTAITFLLLVALFLYGIKRHYLPRPATLNDGYGHTAPLSSGGKAFCIIYSVIGIPFTLLFLTAVVQRIMVFSTRRPIMYFYRRWGVSKPLVAIVHATVLVTTAVSCFFLIAAAIFSALEDNWNFLESFYLCFISLSTIGLGDYVPGEATNQKFRELYKVGITVYLILGRTSPRTRLAILEHDHLSFTTVSNRATVYTEGKTQPFVSVPSL